MSPNTLEVAFYLGFFKLDLLTYLTCITLGTGTFGRSARSAGLNGGRQQKNLR